jgi:hypothetical protein
MLKMAEAQTFLTGLELIGRTANNKPVDIYRRKRRLLSEVARDIIEPSNELTTTS